MSTVSNVSKKKSGRVDGIVAVSVVGAALVFSGFSFANASSNVPVPDTTQTVVSVSGSAGQTITVSGSAGITLP